MDLVAFLYGALACITTERARIAAQDTASASLTVMCTHPALYRAVTSAQHQALAMRKEAHYAGDLVALSDSATADTHEALSDDAEIYDAIAQEQRDAHEHDAHLSTRDDGALYHGRLPHEDSDPFTPWVILPPPSHAALYVQRMGIATLATLATSHHKVTCPACGAMRVARLASYIRREEFAFCGCPVEGITDAAGRAMEMEPDLTPVARHA